MSNSPITDVIFDFCGVLLDWQTRACLTGHFPPGHGGRDMRARRPARVLPL